MTQKHRNNERGFTLIELMVILLVVGILAAIAIPLYIRSRPKPTGADVTGGIRTLNYPFNAGDDQLAWPSPEPSASPPPSPGATEAPSAPPTTIKPSTDAPPVPVASTRTPASAVPSSPTPAGVEPPSLGPPDSG